ncbi:hypothetical protein KEJ27_10230, partial [Candidatus Bathyarchaeota archaeon]|nr:hypothetical protein [Candidatus Bathyarchaeota archaeon]
SEEKPQRPVAVDEGYVSGAGSTQSGYVYAWRVNTCSTGCISGVAGLNMIVGLTMTQKHP